MDDLERVRAQLGMQAGQQFAQARGRLQEVVGEEATHAVEQLVEAMIAASLLGLGDVIAGLGE